MKALSSQFAGIALVMASTLVEVDPIKTSDRCPGTTRPSLPCDAVSAQASEQQASYAATQVTLMQYQTYAGPRDTSCCHLAAFYAMRSAREARRSANAAHEANRPWLTVVASPADNLDYSSSGKPYIKMAFCINNIGNSPATRIVFECEMVPIGSEIPFSIYRHANVCQRARNRGNNKDSFGWTLLPGEKQEFFFAPEIKDEDAANIQKTDDHRSWFSLAILGAVDYGYGEGKRGHTGFNLSLSRFPIDRPVSSMFVPSAGRVDHKELGISNSNLGPPEVS